MGGKRLQGKESATRYRSQMAWVHTDRRWRDDGSTGGVVLRGMPAIAGVMLSLKKGNVGRVVQEIGVTLCVPER